MNCGVKHSMRSPALQRSSKHLEYDKPLWQRKTTPGSYTKCVIMGHMGKWGLSMWAGVNRALQFPCQIGWGKKVWSHFNEMTKTEVYLNEKITHFYVTQKIYLYIYIQRLVLNPHFLKFYLKLSVCTLSSMFYYILRSCLLGLKLLTYSVDIILYNDMTIFLRPIRIDIYLPISVYKPNCCCSSIWLRDAKSSLTLLWPHPTKLLCSWDFPGKHAEVGCHFLLQGIFLTQRSNPHPSLESGFFTT